MISTIGIVGHGAFGSLIHTLLNRFVPSVQVKIFSSRKNRDGATFFSLDEVAQCDAIVLAVPISAFEETLEKVVSLAREDSVLVDVATVKVHTVNMFKKRAGNRPYVAAHPMWGPESYEKKGHDVTGFRIVLTDATIPSDSKNTLVAFLKSLGFDVVEMTAEDHDKHLAESLFLTHYIGQIVARGGFNRTEIDTVSFGFLMDAVESVKKDTKLFEDVFRYNPYCKEIIERFESAESSVRSDLEK